LQDSTLSVYVRHSTRLYNARDGSDRFRVQAFDVATLSVKPKYQTNGLASSLIDFIISLQPQEAIFVENVMSEHLRHIIESRGFVYDGRCDMLPCYLKLTKPVAG
jgi:hypothetical protein